VQDAFGHPQRLVVLGGTSDIARGIAVRLCKERVRTVVLAGRSASLLAEAAGELTAAGATQVETVHFDAREPTLAADTVASCLEAAGGAVDLVVVAVGALGDQGGDEDDAARALDIVNVNYAWPIAALSALRGRLVAQGTGRILVVSSVAGVRVRRVNYLYGGAKAGLDATCIGMAESLRGTGVALQVLRPGFVRSKMTEGRTEAPFTTDVDTVADVAVAGLSTEAMVLWSPPQLRYVFGALALLPQALWRLVPE
jgi:decaprenylphospho-beta-D-erythro-pentofuranosid-2-ulose 2-reductase